MAQKIYSFAPVISENARILILGSMPGDASLEADQYYAHPRNAFWPIMGRLLGFTPDIAYEQKIARLKASGVALWDVLFSCHREGSLDSEIRQESVNDIAGLLQHHTTIRHSYLNGTKAEASFKRHILPTLKPTTQEWARLPSTSPAHAALSVDEKYRAWCIIADALKGKAVPVTL